MRQYVSLNSTSLHRISIHTPLTRCDRLAQKKGANWWKFQSTHLSRGATIYVVVYACQMQISIHTPLTRCDKIILTWLCRYKHFNPHTSHEVRRIVLGQKTTSKGFQSTHLSRGATYTGYKNDEIKDISIHTPLTRCDDIYGDWDAQEREISIHTPLTRCDCTHLKIVASHTISIHTPLTRCDHHIYFENPHYFQYISIHTPLTRCDR